MQITSSINVQSAALRDDRDNAATVFAGGELEVAEFADQRIALPIAYEISCRAWP